MSHVPGLALPRQSDVLSVLASDGQATSGGLASSPYALPAFFLGWVVVGVLMAVVLVARGHDARTMIGLGVGLGPLMALVASETIRHREPAAAALVLEPGEDRGGPLDVLLLVQGDPDDVRSLLPTLEAVRPELGRLTVGRAVAYEWLEGDLDNEVVAAGQRALVDSAERLPVLGVELALCPGPVDVVAKRFRRRRPHGLVLVALPDSGAGSAVTG